MGHMHPDGMVKAIEAKAVVIPEHLTVEMIKQYGKLAEGCGPCLTAVMKKFPTHGDMEEKAKEIGTWHMDVHQLPKPDPQNHTHYIDVVDECSTKGGMIMLWSKTPEAVASAVRNHIAKQKHKVKRIYADDEFCFRMQAALPGVEVVNTIPGRHAKFAERHIQEVQKGVR